MKSQTLLQIFLKAELFTKTINLNKLDFLTKPNVTDTNIYFIKQGSLRIFVKVGDEEQIIRLAYKDNLIAVLDSFFTETPTDFYIQAIKKCEVLVINKTDLLSFLKSNIDYMHVWTNMLENMVLQQLAREKDLLIPSLKDRYERVLKRSPQLFQEIPNKYIANYLRMSPETLSRLKKS